MKSQLNDEIESPVYSVTSQEDDKKLYELTVRMKQLATSVKATDSANGNHVRDSDELADTVIEFLKVSGWSR